MSLCLNVLVKKSLKRSFASISSYYAPRKGDRVVIGMSGGVDSSVTALLLAQQDYDLSAVYMRNWDTRDESGTDKGCEWEKDWEDVQQVCRKLNIPCELVDLSREYWTRVFEPALRHWESGVTPNPDVFCNKEIKFGALLDHISSNNQTSNAFIATGHYARKVWSEPNSSALPRPQLFRPTDKKKDQTYYLSSISELGLSRALFPLSDLTKPQVRQLAHKHQLTTAERPESMGLCFVGERGRFCKFLSSYIPPKPGPFIDQTTGKIIGQHTGLWNYTIGENARISGLPQKMYVASKRANTNTIYCVPKSTHKSLYSSILHVPEFNWIWKDAVPPEVDTPTGFRAMVMHRYRMAATPCTVRRALDGRLTIDCDEPQIAVAPGQMAALWDVDRCLGSGAIESSLPAYQSSGLYK